MTTYTLALLERDMRTNTDVTGRAIEFTSAPLGVWLTRTHQLRHWYPMARVLAITERCEGDGVLVGDVEELAHHEVAPGSAYPKPTVDLTSRDA